MSLSANITDVAAYRDYVQDFREDLVIRAFYGPKSAQYATIREGIKGKETLTRLKVATGKAVAWKKDFEPPTNAVSFHPRHLEVTAIKRELSFVPQEFESTYLGYTRRQGQNPGTDLPFEGFIMQAVLGGHAEELDAAFWGAVKAGSVTAGTTPMAQCFDGWLQIITDEIAGGGIPGSAVVPTPGGAISASNIVELLESMWMSLGNGYKEMPVDVYLSWNNYQLYQQGYRDAFGFNFGNTKDARTTLDFSMNATLIPMPGMGTSDRIVMTPRGNLNVGYDFAGDASMFEFEKMKRVMDFWMDFKVGAQIAQIDEAGLIVNDLE